MSSSAFILIISFINLVLWVFFFILLKRRYSPGKVLDDIKDEVDKLLIVMNQETDRDLTLLEAKLSEIHESLKYADYVLTRLKGEQRISDLEYSEKINMTQESPVVTVSISEEARAGKQTYADEAVTWEQTVTLAPSDTAEPAKAAEPAEADSMQKVNRQQVLDLWRMGQSVAEISRHLDCDMTSVQMIIDMFS